MPSAPSHPSARLRTWLALLLAAFLGHGNVAAQFYEKVLSFTEAGAGELGPHTSNGRNPVSIVEGRDGNFYVTTEQGGSAVQGAIFRVTPTGDFTALVDFTGNGSTEKGQDPLGGMIVGSDGNFFGTTRIGGANDLGTVYRMSQAGVLTTLVEFTGNGTSNKGRGPVASLMQARNGDFYGTTEFGGANDLGTVFRMTPGGVLTTLVQFTGSSGTTIGRRPNCALVEGSDGNFYGTTRLGGANDAGTVFRVTPAGVFTSLVSFSGSGVSNRGAEPIAGLVLGLDGNLYGCTVRGGTNDFGTVFRMTNAGQLTTLVELTGTAGSFKGAVLTAGLALGLDGNLYGATQFGGANNLGTIFLLTPGGQFTTLVEFTGNGAMNKGARPYCTLVRATDGAFYGVTGEGGAKNIGTVFKVTAGGSLTTLGEFAGNVGTRPNGPLLEDSAGFLLGTTFDGGGNDLGTVFKLSPGGALSTLVEFTSTGPSNKGSIPYAGLLRGLDGNYYGSTNGATNVTSTDKGTLFRMTPAGQLTTLIEFTGTGTSNRGAEPIGPLVQTSDGTIYGTTKQGGSNDRGTIFMLGANGILTTLVEFTGNGVFNKGEQPVAGLTRGSEGNFYSVTFFGGGNDFGTAYKMTPGGSLSTLVEFTNNGTSNKGRHPSGTLVEGSDGLLYGTTTLGGLNDCGTVFKMTKTGTLTTIVNFTGNGATNKGDYVYSGLVRGPGDLFYGVTEQGGTAYNGTVFSVTSLGALTTLFDFANDPVDSHPQTPLTFTSDGNLYGATFGDLDAGGVGSIFRLVFPGAPNVYATSADVRSTRDVVINAAVNARGNPSTVEVLYGLSGNALTNTLPLSSGITGFQTQLTGTTLSGLTSGTTYFYRVRATSGAGTVMSTPTSFTTLAEPTVIILPATQVAATAGAASARLNARANARNFNTAVVFEYGTDGNTFPNSVAAAPSVVTGVAETDVSAPVAGLTKGLLYYYRAVATNIAGSTVSGVSTFQTPIEPLVALGPPSAVSSLSVRVTGTVNPRNFATTEIVFEYGAQGGPVLGSVPATPASVSGNDAVTVSALLDNLSQATTYVYRLKATNAGGLAVSSDSSVQPDQLSGFDQSPPAAADGHGFLIVNLLPEGIGGAWRFVGEKQWRTPGVPVGGLASGDREIEFRTVSRYLQPLRELINVVSGDPARVITREYFETTAVTTSQIVVTLKPDSIAGTAVPLAQRGQWRILGENAWRDSDTAAANLAAGIYLVEFKPAAGRITPAPLSLSVAEGETKSVTNTYYLADPPTGLAPEVLPFETISSPEGLPYAFVGQIRSDAGTATGFVVKRRVVATAAHVVFDDGTLAYATGLQWSFQRDSAAYEPVPLVPRGFYIDQGYATKRIQEATPGTSSPASQDLDAAALYFSTDAGRGGFSGYLASNAVQNEWLISHRQKTLVGYPIDGIPAEDQGRIHATPPADVAFQLASGHTYKTSSLSSSGGNSGGPLCVQVDGGNFYPAAIYLGGTGQTVVKAIDGQVIELFRRAKESADGGDDNNTGGIITVNAAVSSAYLASGGLRFNLGPAGAVGGGAGWRVGSGTFIAGAAARTNLVPGTYTVSFKPVDGYLTPALQTVTVAAGNVTDFSAAYTLIEPAAITGAAKARAAQSVPGFAYQPSVTGTQATVSVTLSGGETLATLGLTLNAQTGRLTGTPAKVGTFTLIYTPQNSLGTGAPLAVVLEIAPPGTLTVTASNGGTIAPATALGSTPRQVGTKYILTAKPLPGFLFAGWTGTGAAEVPSAAKALTFTMTELVELRAEFVPNPYPAVAGAFSGLLSSSGVTLTSRGLLSASVTGAGGVSGSVLIGAGRYTLSGAFDAQRSYKRTVTAPGLPPAILDLTLDVGTKSIGGSVTIEGNVLNVAAHHSGFNATTNAWRLPMRYTLNFPAAVGANAPTGTGAGTVTITRGGIATFRGKLADGSTITQSATLGANGEWAFYKLLYGNIGLLTGPLAVQSSAISGQLFWLKANTFAATIDTAGAPAP